MPIRFRCVYCEQLLGIARRKAGTVVKCPNCAGQVIVPAPEQADDSDADAPTAPATDKAPAKQMATVPEKTAPAPATVSSGQGGMLFERSDFDELLKDVARQFAGCVVERRRCQWDQNQQDRKEQFAHARFYQRLKPFFPMSLR